MAGVGCFLLEVMDRALPVEGQEAKDMAKVSVRASWAKGLL